MLHFCNLFVWADINNVVCCISEVLSAGDTLSYKFFNRVFSRYILRVNRVFD